MFSRAADVGYQSGYEVNKSTLHMYTCWFITSSVAFMQRMCVRAFVQVAECVGWWPAGSISPVIWSGLTRNRAKACSC